MEKFFSDYFKNSRLETKQLPMALPGVWYLDPWSLVYGNPWVLVGIYGFLGVPLYGSGWCEMRAEGGSWPLRVSAIGFFARWISCSTSRSLWGFVRFSVGVGALSVAFNVPSLHVPWGSVRGLPNCLSLGFFRLSSLLPGFGVRPLFC